MAVSFGFTEKVVIDGATRTQATTLTADHRHSANVTVPIANDQLYALALDVSQIKAVFLLSDQDLTIETNSPSAPAQTLALKANVPYIWFTNKPQPLVFTTDVTAIYLTNASATVATLQLEILIDPTL